MKLNIHKIQLHMANSCMSINDLAIQANVSRISIGRFINGKSDPRPATVGKIARALGVKVEDVIVMDAATSSEKEKDSKATKSRKEG